MTVSLYSLTDDYRRAMNELTEMDDMPEDVINDTLSGIEGEWQDKAANVAAYIRNLEGEASLQEDAAKRMDKRAKATNAKANRLREYLLREMKAMNKAEISTPELGVNIQQNPPRVVIADNDAVPDEFCIKKYTKVPDKKSIKNHLETDGVLVNWASIERSERLEIK